MSLNLLGGEYSKKVFGAAYEYLLGLGETVPMRRIHIHCTTDHKLGTTIVYNIHPVACINLTLTVEGISFEARFNGKPTTINLEWVDINAIYSPDVEAPFFPRFHDPFGLESAVLLVREERGETDKEVEQVSQSEAIAQKKRSKFTVH